MTRRYGVILVLACALFTGACSSSSTESSSDTTVAPGGTSGVTATTAAGKGSAALADVCAGRSSARQPSPAETVDYNKAATNLQTAVDRAPADIKPDLTVVATPLIQYFKILATSNGNIAQAARDPGFQSLVEKFSQPEYQAASQRVEMWFASHCN